MSIERHANYRPTFSFAVCPKTSAASKRAEEAFAEAKLPAEIEVYDAMHGWCPPDSAVYDEAQAEKACARLLATFKSALA